MPAEFIMHACLQGTISEHSTLQRTYITGDCFLLQRADHNLKIQQGRQQRKKEGDNMLLILLVPECQKPHGIVLDSNLTL